MNSAVIVGGSNGIGLAIAKELIEQGNYVHIFDVVKPELDETEQLSYHFCNLMDFNPEVFEACVNDSKVNFLMITAGLGRVSTFENLDLTEIEKVMNINALSGIKIVRLFYNRIRSEAPFYCGMMGSIAGLISSPMFSVYGASKAAICKFIESVNIELEVDGISNRILNVSPGSIKGTKFNGGNNDIKAIENLASSIIDQIMKKNTLYIPDIEIYGDVLKRYKDNPHEFGISSYNYKKNSGRVNSKSRTIVGYLSGTFDLFHVGHLNLLKRAKEHCDYLIVGVHPSAAHKKKETFIPLEERKAIVESVKYVDRVVDSCAEDSDAWDLYKYNRLFVGSDYKGTERFNRYEEYFKDKDVEIIYFPYTKSTSSTQIRSAISNKNENK